MSWNFETDQEFQEKIDWVAKFVRDKVAPLDVLFPLAMYQPMTAEMRRVIEPLKQEVRDHDLWAAHLDPALGGKGYGQLKLALLNEQLGRSSWAPRIFGTQAPDTGNAEIIAHYGTEEQKKRYLEPLLEGNIVSCFAMTEQHGGNDPGSFVTTAKRDGDQWVINGEKFFASNARNAAFYIVMAVTSPENMPHNGMSMFLVPADTPGVVIDKNFASPSEGPDGASHGLVSFNDVRVPLDAVLGGEGQAFAISQTRLGGGRVHHAMRIVGQAQRALDAICERALSRQTKGAQLSTFQFVQGDIADAYIRVESLRLMVMQTAWKIDKYRDYMKVRKDIAAVKVLGPQVLTEVGRIAVNIHGALGITSDVPFTQMYLGGAVLALTDGSSEVHKITLARQVLRDFEPAEGRWPSEYIPDRLAAAKKQYGIA
jgi:acyl-CoA dehydrogenase